MSPREGWLELDGGVAFIDGYLVSYEEPFPQIHVDTGRDFNEGILVQSRPARMQVWLQWQDLRCPMDFGELVNRLGSLVHLHLEWKGRSHVSMAMLGAVSSDGAGAVAVELATDAKRWEKL